ncbi:MAG TPA: hypothetical protein V6C72_09255, partial [Chroococcales cyanobacterium]
MKIKFPLYAQMASLLVLHFALLVLLIAVFFNTPFGPGWNAIFQSPLGDKVETIAWTIQKQTESHPQSEWNEILEQFGQIYGAKFYVFDCLGKQQGGQPVKLPEPVLAQFTRPGGAPPNFVFHAGPSLAPAIMIDTAGGVTNIGAGPPPFVMLQEGPVHPDGKAHTHAPARGAQVRAFALTGPAGLGPAGMAPPGQEWMPPPMPPPFAGDGPPPPESAGAELGSDIGTVTVPAPPFRPPDWHRPGPHPGVRTLVHTKDPDRFWVVIKQPVVDMSR